MKESMAPLPTATVGDYWTLLKPRVMALVVFTGWCGMVIAPGTLHPVLQITALLSLAMAAGGSGCLNMWMERHRDSLMIRTQNRPLPLGIIEPDSAFSLGLLLCLASWIMMGLALNLTAVSLLITTTVFYLVIYTLILKPRTVQNIVIGGISGALPPVIGWASVTGTINIQSLSLFLIIFLWTPAHFWSLCLVSGQDYANAGLPMLPHVKGEQETKKKIVGYTILTVLATYGPYILKMVSFGYIIMTTFLGFLFLKNAWAVYQGHKTPLKLFGYSILYLFFLFMNLMLFAFNGPFGEYNP